MNQSTFIAAGMSALTLSICLTVMAQPADSAKIDHGKQVYEYWCSTCHGRGLGLFGQGTLPGTMALALKYKGALPPVLEDRKDLDSSLIRTVVRQGIQAMPPYRKTEVSDAELEAIVAYLTRANR